MARVKMQSIVQDMRFQMKRALSAAAEDVGVDIGDENDFYRAFVRAVGRKCSTWERVNDSHVEKE